MKKTILLSILFVCMFCGSLVCINAATARIPSTVPSEGEKLYADIDEEFDFSGISFSTVPEGGVIKGSSTMKKIKLSTGITSTGELDDNWFTAFCLDGMMKYPLYFEGINALPSGDAKLKQAAAIVLFRREGFSELFEKFKGYQTITVTGATAEQSTIDAYEAGNDVNVNIASIEFFKDGASMGTITSAQLFAAQGTTSTGEFSVTFKMSDLKSDIYTAMELPSSLYYNTALWIIEHSYPTLSLEKSLSDAGADYTALYNEIKTMHPAYNDTQLKAVLENYVYSTVQYAIWKADDGYKETVGGTEYSLGDTLYGSNELNKLYKYLTKDRGEYINYNEAVFGKDIDIISPEAGKEIYRENSDSYVYGPYTVETSILSMGDAKLSFTNKDVTGLAIVDVAGNVINTVEDGGQFFIKVMKDSKLGSAQVKVEVTDGIMFEKVSDRARLYSPSNYFEQTVASGGRAIPVTADQTVDITLNPKTGTQDVLMIALIGLIAFAIGYVVLRFKGDSLELS